jgi:hypothetical protein
MADSLDADLRMDAGALYREDVYTDQRLGTIRRLVPVDRTGADDPGRPVIFVGQAHISTPAGTLPISFEIDATSLGQAAENFGSAAKVAIEETMQELQELRRQAASSLVVPEPGAASAILGASGLPAGGKIHQR